jgi:glycosyltransferase involved in cell wall biosynthesis
MKIAVVTPKSIKGERGGAENLYEGLIKALMEAGHEATQVAVLVDESTFEGILEAYCNCFYLDLSDYDLVISTKAPTYMVRHRNHVSYLLHTIRVFYDMFDSEYESNDKEKQKQRRLIHKFDLYGLSPERIKKHFVNGSAVYERMRALDDHWKSINFQVLHHPPTLSNFKKPKAGEIIFLPGRLHRWKRPDLIIKAMKYVNHDVDLIISGRGEDEAQYRQLSSGDNRIKFVGWINDNEIVDYYSRSVVIPFVPINEDYGLVTVEAFKSKKPIITCTDSGEPCYIVKDGVNGFIVEPDPKKIAEKINYLIENPQESTRMGANGYTSVQDITWELVVSSLLKDIEISSCKKIIPEINVLITDMQPIEPAVGGGRLRLKGLYSNFPPNLKALYVGTYDWRGPKQRELQISESLKEIDIPLDEEHFKINEHLNKLLPGVTIIDVVFPLLAKASQEYVNVVLHEAKKADVVVLSHPWLYPIIKTNINLKNKILIYDSHNCEALLRQNILGNTHFARCITHMVKFVEKELCEESDLILACSETDKAQFEKLYDIDPQKIEVYPNGVATNRIKPVNDLVRNANKKHLQIDKKTAMFIGSNYPPNVEAAEYIINTLSKQCPEITFLIVGGVGTNIGLKGQDNIKIFGLVSEEDKDKIFAASDIAINPILHGSGTNIKMFDYFAAGIPTISTQVGARGIENDGSFIVCDLPNFPNEIRKLLQDEVLYKKLSNSGRALAEKDYDWNKISYNLGKRISDIYSNQSPTLSVIIPMYRGNYINDLFDKLNRQTFRDFEVIVVDSGEERGDHLYEISNFKLKYIYNKNVGAAKARNIGIKHARGEIIAFTDDDCQPDADWLENAKKHFDKYKSAAGLEGLIYTDESKLGDNRYRIVTNKGFKGIGFMTANLFIRHDIITKIGGFDERFDKPHFREDTDLAWRAQYYGQIPFADGVRVYHPPILRNLKGESKDDRDYFFVNDALLFSKHPDKYINLMRAEGHYIKNKNFWRFFRDGCEQINHMALLDEMARYPDIRRYMSESIKYIGE